jgi:hypothetical protein
MLWTKYGKPESNSLERSPASANLNLGADVSFDSSNCIPEI